MFAAPGRATHATCHIARASGMCMHAHVRAVDGTRKKPLVVSRLLARAEPLLARVRLLLAPFVPDDVRLLPISFAPMDRGRQKTRNEALAEDLLKEVNQLRQRSASCIHACTRAHARARARARTHTHTHTHTQDRSERKAAMAAATADEVAACTFRLDQLLVYDQYTLVHVCTEFIRSDADGRARC